MKPKYILFGLLALLAASCANDDLNEVAEMKQNGIQVTAGLTANTRVNFEQDGNVTHALWEEGDQITLYAPSQGYLPYQVSTLSEDATSATFTPINDALQNTDETIYAAHRAGMEAEIADGMATLPNTDTWTDEHPLPFAYAISKVADGKLNLSFEHVFAYLKLTLNAETVAGSTNKSIAVIGLSTTSDEPLSNIYGFFNIPEQEYVIEKGSNHMFFTLQEPFTATGTAEKSVYIPILPQPAGETITINVFSDYEANDILFTVSKEVPSTGFVAGRAYTYSPKSSTTRVGNTVTLTEAGTLSQAISETEKDTITSLKIIGPLNGDDIRFIREMAGDVDPHGSTEPIVGNLTNLDISEATIVEGGAAYYDNYYTSNDVIGEWMFYNSYLEKVLLPTNLTSISANAFFDCFYLENITIPNSVASIGDCAFYECRSLSQLTCHATIPPILLGYEVFSAIASPATLIVPSGTYAAYMASDWAQYFTTIDDGEEHEYVELLVNGDAEGSDYSCFTSKEARGEFLTSRVTEAGMGADGVGRAYVVTSDDMVEAAWDTQFFITAMETVNEGDLISFSMKYKADKEAFSGTQWHIEPGNYIHWDAIGGLTFTTEWQEYNYVGLIDGSSNGGKTISFQLNDFEEANTYYFDDISLKVLKR